MMKNTRKELTLFTSMSAPKVALRIVPLDYNKTVPTGKWLYIPCAMSVPSESFSGFKGQLWIVPLNYNKTSDSIYIPYATGIVKVSMKRPHTSTVWDGTFERLNKWHRDNTLTLQASGFKLKPPGPPPASLFLETSFFYYFISDQLTLDTLTWLSNTEVAINCDLGFKATITYSVKKQSN